MRDWKLNHVIIIKILFPLEKLMVLLMPINVMISLKEKLGCHALQSRNAVQKRAFFRSVA